MDIKEGQVQKIQFIQDFKNYFERMFRKHEIIESIYSKSFNAWVYYGEKIYFIPKEYVRIYTY